MPDVCIGCGLTIDDLGNLVADALPLPSPFPTGQQAAHVFCDPVDGGLKVAEEGTLANMTALTGATGLGDPVPAGASIRIHAGTSTQICNGFGLCTIALPDPFPNGILGVSVIPTTGAGAGFCQVDATGCTVGSLSVLVWNPGVGGAAVHTGSVTLSWVAVGW